jgi:hypothetical protein
MEKIRPKPNQWLFHSIWLYIVGISLFRGFYLAEPDILWETRAGQDILKTGHIVMPDTWNFLIHGKLWLPNSWLWDVVLAQFYKFGIVGVSVFTSLVCAGTLFMVWKLISLAGVKERLTQLVIILVVSIAAASWLSGRPQGADFALMLGFFILLLKLINFSWKKRLWITSIASFVIIALWMNLHLTGIFGVFMLAGGYWFVSTFHYSERIRARILASSLIILTGLAGSLATPFGLSGITKSLVVANASNNLITEWEPINPADPLFPSVLVALIVFGLGFFVLAFVKRKWLFVTAIFVLSVATFEAIRFAPFLLFFSLLGVSLIPKIRMTKQLPLLAVLSFATTVLVLIAGLGYAGYQTIHPDKISSTSPKDLDPVPYGSRLLTLQGGDAILFRPDIQTSLDGRNDILGKKIFGEVFDLYQKDNAKQLETWLNTHKVNYVFAQADNPTYRIYSSMKTLGWKTTKVPDGLIYSRP